MWAISLAGIPIRIRVQTNRATDLILKLAQPDFLFLCGRIEMCANWARSILRAVEILRVK